MKIVNQLLGNEESVISFRFLINGKYLRGSLKSHISAHKVDTEQTVVIKYDINPMKPKLIKSKDQEDWIMSLSSEKGESFIVGLCNGTITLFSNSYSELAKSELSGNETVKCSAMTDV